MGSETWVCFTVQVPLSVVCQVSAVSAGALWSLPHQWQLSVSGSQGPTIRAGGQIRFRAAPGCR